MLCLNLFTLSLLPLVSSFWNMWSSQLDSHPFICVTIWALVLKVIKGDQSANKNLSIPPPPSLLWVQQTGQLFNPRTIFLEHGALQQFIQYVLTIATTEEFFVLGQHLSSPLAYSISLWRSIQCVMSINHQATPLLLLSEVFAQVVKVEGIVNWEHLTLWCHNENVYGALDKETGTVELQYLSVANVLFLS